MNDCFLSLQIFLDFYLLFLSFFFIYLFIKSKSRFGEEMNVIETNPLFLDFSHLQGLRFE